MTDNKNSIVDIKKYFERDDKPISTKEFNDFWKSLTEEEKEDFKKADLK